MRSGVYEWHKPTHVLGDVAYKGMCQIWAVGDIGPLGFQVQNILLNKE